MWDRFKKSHEFFCPPPPTRKGDAQEVCPVDKVRSALGSEYNKSLHFCIAHLRRADGGLRPKGAERAVGSMNLLAAGDAARLVA